jgi:chromate transport protein ChrA
MDWVLSMNIRNFALNMITGSISLLVAIYILFSVDYAGFNILWILPLSYSISSILYLNRSMFISIPWFRISFNAVFFLRFVVSPFIMVLTNNYHGVSNYKPTPNQVHLAILLMVYELIVCTLTIYILDLKKKNKSTKISITKDCFKNLKNNIVLVQKKDFYIVFILVTVILLMVNPNTLQYFTLIIPRGSGLGMNLGKTSIIAEATIMSLIVSKALLFLILMSKIKEKHDKNGKYRYVLFAIIVVLLNSSIYYGQNRSQFLFSAIASLYVFILLFPTKKKVVILWLILSFMIIIPLMSQARNPYDYFYYESGMRKTLLESQRKITEYFGGVTNVSIGLETANIFPDNRNLLNLVYDIIRPIVGVNIIVSNLNIPYSNVLFNYTYYQFDFVSVIFPTIAQGYFYFGFFLAPLIEIFLIIIAIKIESIARETNRIEYLFIFVSSLLRLGTMAGANLNLQMNDLSMQIMVPILIIWINNRISLRSKYN